MNDIQTLPISIDSPFKEIPANLRVVQKKIPVTLLCIPHTQFDPQTEPAMVSLCPDLIPLVVSFEPSGSYRIIDGCKRFSLYEKKGTQQVVCQVIETPLSDCALGLLRISLNMNRPFQLREKYWIVEWLQKTHSPDDWKSKALKTGLTGKEITMLCGLMVCPEYSKKAFFDGFLDLSLVSHLTTLTDRDQQCFIETFQSLKLSYQVQREFLDWLPEIACLHNSSVESILRNPDIQQILESNSDNAPQKINKIRSKLSLLKYPLLSKAKAIWKNHVDKVNPAPAHVTFTHDMNFEKNRLEIKIVIKDAQEAVKVFHKVASITKDQWEKLIYPL